MARSATRPIVGSIVWLLDASPPTIYPQAAMVVGINTAAGSGFGVGMPGAGPKLDLIVFQPTGNTAPALAVQFYYGTRPPPGAVNWCTMPRVNMPASPTAYPSGAAVGE
jgi:hypothetical protein